MLFGKFPSLSLTACLMLSGWLSGCDSSRDTGQTTDQGASQITDQATEQATEQVSTPDRIKLPPPERIRTSLAVDFSQVAGMANVNGRLHDMEQSDTGFSVQVPNIMANSVVSIDLLFSETLADGRILNLAETESLSFPVGDTNANAVIEISEDQFSYALDDDLDGINNINERNDGTDPFVPQNTGTRRITVQFNLPQRIQDPGITQVRALIADVPRGVTRQENFVQTNGTVPNGSTIDVEVALQQRFDGSPIIIAQAQDQVDAGNEDQTVLFQDDDFDFDIDADQDGVSNLDEIQSGRDPFIAN